MVRMKDRNSFQQLFNQTILELAWTACEFEIVKVLSQSQKSHNAMNSKVTRAQRLGLTIKFCRPL